MAIHTMEEMEDYYHDDDVDTLNFPHISDTVQRILRGNDRLLPLFLSNIPLLHTNNVTVLITTLRDTPRFVFTSENIRGIIEGILDVHDFYSLSPEKKEELINQLFSTLPLDTTERIDEFIHASELSLDPRGHASIVRNISQYRGAKTLLPYFLFKKGIALYGINGYVDSFLATLDESERQMNLAILKKMLDHPDLSRAHMERLNEKLREYGALRKSRVNQKTRSVTNQTKAQLVDRRRRKRSRFKHVSTVRARLSSK